MSQSQEGIPEKIRRGRGKGKLKAKGLKIMYNNINRLISKMTSLENIVESVDPDIIALCETKKASRTKKTELKNYNVIECPLKAEKEGMYID